MPKQNFKLYFRGSDLKALSNLTEPFYGIVNFEIDLEDTRIIIVENTVDIRALDGANNELSRKVGCPMPPCVGKPSFITDTLCSDEIVRLIGLSEGDTIL